jgi:hypothetical protein
MTDICIDRINPNFGLRGPGSFVTLELVWTNCLEYNQIMQAVLSRSQSVLNI